MVPRIFPAIGAVLLVVPLASVQAAIQLPPADANNSQVYGDFTVFSIAMLNVAATGDISQAKNGPFQIDSNGVLAELALLASANGQADNDGNVGDNGDDAYVIPQNPSFYGTNAGDEPGPVIPDDNAGTWDITVSALRTFLGLNDAVFVFDFNEPGDAGSGLNGEDLLAWASFTLVDTDGGGGSVSFFMTADPGDTVGPTPMQINEGDPYDNDWVRAHGTVTVDENENFVHFGKPFLGDPATYQEVDQNLGNDRAEFAFFSDALNDLIRSTNIYDVLRVDLRGAALDNGSEQLFILAQGITVSAVPEMASVLTWCGLALVAGVGIRIRRDRR